MSIALQNEQFGCSNSIAITQTKGPATTVARPFFLMTLNN
jgi:hypothetical protein